MIDHRDTTTEPGRGASGSPARLPRDSGASRIATVFGGIAAVIAAALFLQSCSGERAATNATCSDYLAMSGEQQESTITNLLSAHDLVTSDYVNRSGAQTSISSFCSNAGNGDRQIEESIDWDSPYW